jgi:hypothetical protein
VVLRGDGVTRGPDERSAVHHSFRKALRGSVRTFSPGFDLFLSKAWGRSQSDSLSDGETGGPTVAVMKTEASKLAEARLWRLHDTKAEELCRGRTNVKLLMPASAAL